MNDFVPRVDPELVRRFDRPGPRYTSYPTAVEFHEGVGAATYLDHLARAGARGADDPLSLYVHIPFCKQHCSYCGCHVIATPRHDVAHAYLDRVRREIEIAAAPLGRRRTLVQMHWGGGTPTYLEPDELELLHQHIAAEFRFAPDAEKAIEVDPRVTTPAQIETLARLGFNRLSMGVQDFTPEVQVAIGRGQTFEETRDLVATARAVGFREGINLDFVYGLPQQTLASFRTNLDRLIELKPDRLALYSFAYVPWIRPNQKKIDAATLPVRDDKAALYLSALTALVDAGYEPIGMDHFALPGDELARAARAGRLDRNFMGYTVKPASAMVAFGVSGISEVEGAFFQNERKLSTYGAALDAGRPPIQRGYVLDEDDRIRQWVIRQLMCNFAVDKAAVSERFGIDFDDYFAASLAKLGDVRDAGLVEEDAGRLAVRPEGRLFVRIVCMAFDRYLEKSTAAAAAAGRPAFSRTV